MNDALHRLDININIRLAWFDYYKAFDLVWFCGPMCHFHSAINMHSIIYMGLYASSWWPSYKHVIFFLVVQSVYYVLYIYIYIYLYIYIWVYMQIFYKGFIILLLALHHIFVVKQYINARDMKFIPNEIRIMFSRFLALLWFLILILKTLMFDL